MTKEEFIEVLDEKGYSYEIEGDKIIVTEEGNVSLKSLTSISPDVEFKNGGYVDLRDLTSLPPGVVFKNGEDVWLRSIIDGWSHVWDGNIKGIDSKMLLNGMIKRGIFL